MLNFLAKAAFQLGKQYLNEKKICTKPGCTNFRLETYELCKEHQEDELGNGCGIFAVVLILIVAALIYFN